MTQWEDRFDRQPRRTALNVGVSAIGIAAVLGVVGALVFGATNFVTQAGRVVAKTIDADNVIYNYEWFRQQYQDVIAIDGKIATMKAGTEMATGDEKIRLNSIVLGLETKRAQMVADYNARGMMANRTIFIAGLPQQIQ